MGTARPTTARHPTTAGLIVTAVERIGTAGLIADVVGSATAGLIADVVGSADRSWSRPHPALAAAPAARARPGACRAAAILRPP